MANYILIYLRIYVIYYYSNVLLFLFSIIFYSLNKPNNKTRNPKLELRTDHDDTRASFTFAMDKTAEPTNNDDMGNTPTKKGELTNADHGSASQPGSIDDRKEGTMHPETAKEGPRAMPKRGRPEVDKACRLSNCRKSPRSSKEPTRDGSVVNEQANGAGSGTALKPHGDEVAERTKPSVAETGNGDNERGSKLEETETIEGVDNEEVSETSDLRETKSAALPSAGKEDGCKKYEHNNDPKDGRECRTEGCSKYRIPKCDR